MADAGKFAAATPGGGRPEAGLLNEIKPLRYGEGLHAAVGFSNAEIRQRMKEFREFWDVRTSNSKINDGLVAIMSDAVFSPGLPLLIFEEGTTPKTQRVVDLGLFQTAEEARSAAASHFAGTGDGQAFEELRERLRVRLDIRGEAKFSAMLPFELKLTHEPVPAP